MAPRTPRCSTGFYPHQSNIGLGSPGERSGKAHHCPGMCRSMAQPNCHHGAHVGLWSQGCATGCTKCSGKDPFQARIQNERKHPHYSLRSLTFNTASSLPQGSSWGRALLFTSIKCQIQFPHALMWVGSHKLQVNIDFPMTLF